MHFLAHIYLSGDSSSIMVGNFIGEVKTITDPTIYENEIREGINLHKLIDDFTNNHEAIQRSRKRLNPRFSKYSDTIIDVFYDHFLAANWSDYSEVTLEKFAMNSYRTLLNHQEVLPYKAKCLLPLMIKGNWLAKYVSLGGVHQTIREMDMRSTKLTHIIQASEDLIANYSSFKADFDEFFPELINYVNVVKVHELSEAKEEVAVA
jgi:acyl carrier protein phosphodiesterase